MKCPLCKDTVLTPHELDEQLPSRWCSKCNGQWIEGARYHLWVERHREELPTGQTQAATSMSVGDGGPAKLCPECGRFLTRGKVGHGVAFCIDRCVACGGIWLDANEWEVLKGRGLHDDLHFVFSSAWQAEVARQEREQAEEQMLIEKLGAGDLAEIRKVKAWIDGHPKKSELYAYLLKKG